MSLTKKIVASIALTLVAPFMDASAWLFSQPHLPYQQLIPLSGYCQPDNNYNH